MQNNVRILEQPTDGLSDRIEEEIEAAYWEMKAREDPTNDKYPNTGERYSFKMAVRAIFHRLRNEG